MNRKLVSLFKRVGISEQEQAGITNMPDDFQRGFYDGYVCGRESQRKADIEAADNKFYKEGKQ